MYIICGYQTDIPQATFRPWRLSSSLPNFSLVYLKNIMSVTSMW